MTVAARRLVLLATLAATVSGCAFTTANLALTYEPSKERKSPLSTIPPRRIAVTVEDQRPTGERNRIGDKRNNLGMVTASVQSSRDVSSVVRDALEAELRDNGHTVTEPRVPSDVAVIAVLKRFWGDLVIRFSEVVVVGRVVADVAIDGGAGRGGSRPQPLVATSEEGFKIMTDGRFETVMNKALAEFVRIFARDPAVLEALRGPK